MGPSSVDLAAIAFDPGGRRGRLCYPARQPSGPPKQRLERGSWQRSNDANANDPRLHARARNGNGPPSRVFQRGPTTRFSCSAAAPRRCRVLCRQRAAGREALVGARIGSVGGVVRARIVGRWPSGQPLMRPVSDPDPSESNLTTNYFDFANCCRIWGFGLVHRRGDYWDRRRSFQMSSIGVPNRPMPRSAGLGLARAVAETPAAERGTWFDMCPGRGARSEKCRW
jgi:hypothetical protein